MAPREQLEREIEQLEARLHRASDARAIDELATVRRGLGSSGPRGPAIELPNLRLGFACKQRWEDMVGDDRVRACGGCDRPVFNLSEMTRAEAEAVLATRGLTPCVRFYRRPDGTVMTTDCPTGVRRGGRRLAVVASSLTAGATLAAAPTARAEPLPAESAPAEDDATTAEPSDAPSDPAADPGSGEPAGSEAPTRDPIVIERQILMGIPVPGYDVEMGIISSTEERPRPALEWSVWGRLGAGVASQRPDAIARQVTPPMVESASTSTWEAALAADLTFRVALDGDLRLGIWGEVRTSSDPVAGGELVLEGLPPHPYSRSFGGSGSLVLRAGGNSRVITGALGFGYVGSWPRSDPWIRWMRHVVGARVVVSMNRAIDDPHDWSATLGLEVEPLGVLHGLLDLVTH